MLFSDGNNGVFSRERGRMLSKYLFTYAAYISFLLCFSKNRFVILIFNLEFGLKKKKRIKKTYKNNDVAFFARPCIHGNRTRELPEHGQRCKCELLCVNMSCDKRLSPTVP